MKSLLVSLSTLLLLLLAASTTSGMYEDQVGQVEWLRQGVGEVGKAVFHPASKSLKSVYTLNRDGTTVASLKTKSDNGEVRWKRNFGEGSSEETSDPIVCLAAIESSVIVGSRNGVFTYLDPKEGVPTLTTKLNKNVLSKGLSVKDCIATSSKLSILLGDGAKTVATVVAAVESPLDDVSTKLHTELEGPVKSLGISETHVWTQVQGGSISATPSDGSKGTVLVPFTPDHPASIQNVGPVFTTVLADDGHLSAFRIEAKSNELKKHIITTTTTSPEYLNARTMVNTHNIASPESVFVHEKVGDFLEVRVEGINGALLTLPSLNRPGLPTACKCGKYGTRVLAARSTKPKESYEALIQTTDGHLLFVSSSKLAWTRNEGLSSLAAVEFAELPNGDKFGFNQLIVGASKQGTLYGLTTTSKAQDLKFSVDWLAEYIIAAKDQQEGWKFQGFPNVHSLTVQSGNIAQLIVVDPENGLAAKMLFNIVEGTCTSVTFVSDFVAVLGDKLAAKGDSSSEVAMVTNVAGQKNSDEEQFYYTVDKETGSIIGYASKANSFKVRQAWSVNFRCPLVAMAAGSDLALATTDAIRTFPNRTSKVLEVKTKYSLMQNVLVVARFENDGDEEDAPTLHVAAINTLTGAVLATARHENVDGAVKLSVVEHLVVYHYTNVKNFRYFVGVWELFDKQDMIVTEASLTNPAQIASSALAKKRKVSPFNFRPPTVAVHSLLFPSDIAVMAPTVSLDGIARKMMVFVTKNGEVAAVDLRHLTLGFKDGAFETLNNAPVQVVYPDQKVLSHRFFVGRPTMIVTEPTLLESTSHIAVVGEDIFYTRATQGKSFDVLSSDFSWRPLVMGAAGLAVASVLLKYLSQRRNLKAQWA